MRKMWSATSLLSGVNPSSSSTIRLASTYRVMSFSTERSAIAELS